MTALDPGAGVWRRYAGFAKTKPTREKSFFFVCLTGDRAAQAGEYDIRDKVRRMRTQFSFSCSGGVPSGRLRPETGQALSHIGQILGGLHAHRISKPDGWPLPRDIGSRRLVADRHPGYPRDFRVMSGDRGPTSESPQLSIPG